MSTKQRIPKDITVLDLVAFAESIGCIVDIHFVDKQRPTKRAPDARKSAPKSRSKTSKGSVKPARG